MDSTTSKQEHKLEEKYLSADKSEVGGSAAPKPNTPSSAQNGRACGTTMEDDDQNYFGGTSSAGDGDGDGACYSSSSTTSGAKDVVGAAPMAADGATTTSNQKDHHDDDINKDTSVCTSNIVTASRTPSATYTGTTSDEGPNANSTSTDRKAGASSYTSSDQDNVKVAASVAHASTTAAVYSHRMRYAENATDHIEQSSSSNNKKQKKKITIEEARANIKCLSHEELLIASRQALKRHLSLQKKLKSQRHEQEQQQQEQEQQQQQQQQEQRKHQRSILSRHHYHQEEQPNMMASMKETRIDDNAMIAASMFLSGHDHKKNTDEDVDGDEGNMKTKSLFAAFAKSGNDNKNNDTIHRNNKSDDGDNDEQLSPEGMILHERLQQKAREIISKDINNTTFAHALLQLCAMAGGIVPNDNTKMIPQTVNAKVRPEDIMSYNNTSKSRRTGTVAAAAARAAAARAAREGEGSSDLSSSREEGSGGSHNGESSGGGNAYLSSLSSSVMYKKRNESSSNSSNDRHDDDDTTRKKKSSSAAAYYAPSDECHNSYDGRLSSLSSSNNPVDVATRRDGFDINSSQGSDSNSNDNKDSSDKQRDDDKKLHHSNVNGKTMAHQGSSETSSSPDNNDVQQQKNNIVFQKHSNRNDYIESLHAANEIMQNMYRDNNRGEKRKAPPEDGNILKRNYISKQSPSDLNIKNDTTASTTKVAAAATFATKGRNSDESISSSNGQLSSSEDGEGGISSSLSDSTTPQYSVSSDQAVYDGNGMNIHTNEDEKKKNDSSSASSPEKPPAINVVDSTEANRTKSKHPKNEKKERALSTFDEQQPGEQSNNRNNIIDPRYRIQWEQMLNERPDSSDVQGITDWLLRLFDLATLSAASEAAVLTSNNNSNSASRSSSSGGFKGDDEHEGTTRTDSTNSSSANDNCETKEKGTTMNTGDRKIQASSYNEK